MVQRNWQQKCLNLEPAGKVSEKVNQYIEVLSFVESQVVWVN